MKARKVQIVYTIAGETYATSALLHNIPREGEMIGISEIASNITSKDVLEVDSVHHVLLKREPFSKTLIRLKESNKLKILF